jgi:Ca2+-binding EF-hand superfamily protein
VKRHGAKERLTSTASLLALCCSLSIAGPGAAQSRSSYFDAVDTDHDGRISLAEFHERMSWAFRQMDRNGDEVLSPQEQLVPNAPELTLAELRRRQAEQYRRQDKNRDGSLSESEFLAPPG